MMAASSAPFIILLFVPAVCEYNQIATTLTVSSVYRHQDASLANDGDFSQDIRRCTHTDTKKGIKEAWLRLDLVDVYSIKSVKFWYRNDRSNSRNTIRLLGYSIRVSNDSVLPPAETSCYTDSGNVTLPSVIEKDCERTARYVWIYQDNILDGDCPMLEICEVQLFGSYGVNCSNTCDHCQNNASCGITSGECDSNGCADENLAPPLCYPCSVGEYGNNCENHCGHCLDNEACSRFDGTCRACESGYQGSHCDKKCSAGTYGGNCSEICGACLDHAPCHHVDGHCPSGCSPGWQSTPNCDASCPPGTFGPNCINKCSGNCLHHATCDKETGKWKGCSEGWKNDFCNERKAITDLEKMTLEHLKLDNQRLVLESGMLKKEAEKISSETSFLKLKEKYLRLKIQSEFPVFLRNDPTISSSEQKAGQNLGNGAGNVPTHSQKQHS